MKTIHLCGFLAVSLLWGCHDSPTEPVAPSPTPTPQPIYTATNTPTVTPTPCGFTVCGNCTCPPSNVTPAPTPAPTSTPTVIPTVIPTATPTPQACPPGPGGVC